MAMAKQRRVAALSGRRIDFPGSQPPYFPLDRVPIVAKSIEALFVREGIDLLVCSAACGADLIALQIAARRDMQWRIVLPFDLEKFRRTSVNDRPGNWGRVLDEVLETTKPTELIVMSPSASDEAAYELAAIELVRQALRADAVEVPLAICVWEGRSKGPNDVTALFVSHAQEAHMVVRQIPILADD